MRLQRETGLAVDFLWHNRINPPRVQPHPVVLQWKIDLDLEQGTGSRNGVREEVQYTWSMIERGRMRVQPE
jgi:hypothetical protein